MTFKFKVILLALISLLLAVGFFNLIQHTTTAQAQTTTPLTAMLRWGYYVKTPVSLESVRSNIGSLNIISPVYFNLRPDGSLIGTDQAEVTNLAKSKGVRVIPTIQNSATVLDDFTKVINDPTQVKRIIDQIEGLVNTNGYDGIHIDFENLNATDRPQFTNFMGQLYARLKAKNKLTTAALVSKTRDTTTGFGGVYDYAALAPYLDLAVIMVYDYHYRGGSDGPVAPINWSSSVVAFASSQLGPGKVMLGVPFYGYDWNVSKGGFATARSFDDTQDTIRKFKGTTGYDETVQEAFADYSDNGEAHRIWFQNPRSLQAKLDLMKKNNLAGFAAWRLGQEGASFWPVVRNFTLPTNPIAAFASKPDRTYFAQTGHSLSGQFKIYWDKNGGLAQFGYPWTEEFLERNPSDGKDYVVQYFERARFEYHPDLKGTPFEVQLGLLGRQVTTGRSEEAPFKALAPFQSRADVWYIPETGHSLSYGFLQYWLKNGGLAIYGYPISEEFQEISPTDGKTYTVQYFERNRFEYHPENKGTRYEVLLGLLGNQIMKDYGWLRAET
ncbi:MAG: peptidoglycan hydrolase [Chloroflexi bacterium]|uniref:Glycosyl hydrolase family 18 protein n=1 Tax=Candidatus Chlorohelix allophototropha TaxID=3003348 RepID=A0A8T7LZL0_9CHLR|nr:peptidoglycan hydrolase [Chloroflexota bacterium]WJW66742.1 glycosyl hydrolase family 18 protein [Chloroflexota bacterium L227-S17]